MDTRKVSLQEQAVRAYQEELRQAENKDRPVTGITQAARRAHTSTRTVARNSRANTLVVSARPYTLAPSDIMEVPEHEHGNITRRPTFTEPEEEENSDDYDTDLEDNGNPTRAKDAIVANMKAEAVWVSQYKTECRQLNVVPIGQAIGQMDKKRWQLRKCAISSREMQALSRLIVSKFDLVALDFTSSAIGPDGLRFLIAAIMENRSIEEIDLTENELGSEGCRLLCGHLDVLDRIRVLNLNANHLKPTDGQHLAELIRKLVALRELHLSKNELGERGVEVIAEALCDNTTLQTLDLSWNHIRLGGARALGNSLNENQSLKTLNLGWNGFADEAIKPLSRALEINQGLQEIDLSCNRIGLEGAILLAKALEKNDTLQTLVLNQNLITTRGAEYILNAIKKNLNSHVEQVEMQNVSVTYNFAAAYNELLAIRRVVIVHDKYVRCADIINAEGPNAKEVLKMPAAEVLRTFFSKRQIDITKQEIVVNRKPEKKEDEAIDEEDGELEIRYAPETISLAIEVNADTGASTVDPHHFKLLLKKLCAPLQDSQVEQILKKVAKNGQLDVTQFLPQNLSPDLEAGLIKASPEKTALYSS